MIKCAAMNVGFRCFCAFAAMLLSIQSAKSRPLDDVVASGTLRIIAYADNRPFSWEGSAGEPRGIDVDLGRAIALKLGVKAEIVLRMQGEQVDDDLRANVWKGPLTGGGVGDIMMHVPTDKDFVNRNREAVIGNAYFEERVAVAVDSDRLTNITSFDIFKTQPIAVQLGTVADYFLLTYDDGALINNVHHYVRPPEGAERFLAKETIALMGVRSQIEGLLYEKRAKTTILEPPMPGIARSRWVVGMAVSEQSRDLRDAVGNALNDLRKTGQLQKIFAAYGVSYFPPPKN